jgi:hypothetical protein
LHVNILVEVVSLSLRNFIFSSMCLIILVDFA